MVLTAGALDALPPSTMALGGSLRVADGVEFIEDDEGSGSVFLWGMAAWSWRARERVARRLAAVQLVETKAARQRQVAAAFGVNEDSLILWRGEYATKGVAGLAGRRPGPKGPSKLTEAKRDEIGALRAEGLTLTAVADRVGVSTDTVRRALARAPLRPTVDEPVREPALVPLPRPADCSVRRQAARAGLITEAPPVVCEGTSLPLAGALIILPTLAATGLLDAADRVYDTGRAPYGLRSLVLSIVFACLLGEPRAEGLTNFDPADTGRLLGLDRAPEVNTMRRRMQELAALGRAAWLIDALARRHLETHDEVEGILYFDGHVRAYHRAVEIGKADVARIRLSMGADIDAWVFDRNGDGVLVWTTSAEASDVDELRVVTSKVRDLVGPDAHPTVCFDRGGWPPKLFAELAAAGFEIFTYCKGLTQAEPRSAFQCHRFTDESGRVHDYLLALRDVRIGYDRGRRCFACRQITRLAPRTGHQTHILTTRGDPDPATIAHATFHRWGQEPFDDYMRAHHGLDDLDSYATTGDDACTTPNPTRADAELLASAAPAKLPVGDVGPDAACLAPERRRIHDAVRMATYNAESALARVLAPHHSRADDEARCLLRETFRTPADLQIIGNELHVRLDSLSAPRRSRAIAALCDDLTAINTLYPGTNLTLVYSMGDHG